MPTLRKLFILCFLFCWEVSRNTWIFYSLDNTSRQKFHWLVLNCISFVSFERRISIEFLQQSTVTSEKQLKFSPDEKDLSTAIKDITDLQQKDAVKNIILRNRGLRLLHSLLFTSRNTVNNHLCDDISRILGLDWILLLLQPQIHSSTVILGKNHS